MHLPPSSVGSLIRAELPFLPGEKEANAVIRFLFCCCSPLLPEPLFSYNLISPKLLSPCQRGPGLAEGFRSLEGEENQRMETLNIISSTKFPKETRLQMLHKPRRSCFQIPVMSQKPPQCQALHEHIPAHNPFPGPVLQEFKTRSLRHVKEVGKHPLFNMNVEQLP